MDTQQIRKLHNKHRYEQLRKGHLFGRNRTGRRQESRKEIGEELEND